MAANPIPLSEAECQRLMAVLMQRQQARETLLYAAQAVTMVVQALLRQHGQDPDTAGDWVFDPAQGTLRHPLAGDTPDPGAPRHNERP